MPICLPFFNQRRKVLSQGSQQTISSTQRARTAPPGITSSSKRGQKAGNPRPECMRAESLQSCLTLCDPTNCSLPGSSHHGILSRQEHWSGHHGLLQGIFPSQGSNPRLQHWQAGSLPLGVPIKVLEEGIVKLRRGN